MRKVLGRMKQTISVLLAVAMIVTALPQTNMSAYAAESEGQSGLDDDATEQSDRSDEMIADDQGNSEDETEKQEPPEAGNTGSVEDAEDLNDENSTQQEEEDSGEADADSTEADDGTDSETPEEEKTASLKVLAEDETAETDGMQEGQNDSKTLQNAVVRVRLPYYMSGNKGNEQTSLISAFSYAIGEAEEFTTLEQQGTGFTTDLSVPAGSKLRFQFDLIDHAELRNVQYYTKFDSYSKTEIQAEAGIYEITIPEDESYGENVYDYVIEIDVKHTYNISFVDVYAGEHEGTKSVKLYKQGTGDETTSVDMIGETVTVAEDQLSDFFGDKISYLLEAEEGYTFYNIDFNTTQIRRSSVKGDKRRNVYCFQVRNEYSLPEDIKIYVTMEKTQTRQLQFRIPDDLKEQMSVTVYGRKANEESSSPLEGMAADHSISVSDDVSISFEVTLRNGLGHSVLVDYQEDGGLKEVLVRDDMRQTDAADGWICSYSLGTLKNGDVTVNLSQTDTYKVIMKPDWEVLGSLEIGEPFQATYDGYDAENQPPAEIPFYIPAGEKLYYHATVRESMGTVDVSIAENGDGELGTEAVDEVWYETVLPHSDLTVCLGGKPYEYLIDYYDGDAAVLVYNHDTGEQLALSETNRISSNNGWINLRILVKPAEGKSVDVAYHSVDEEGQTAYAERDSEYDRDGYQCYLIDAVSMADRTIKIEAYTVHTVRFDKKNSALSLERLYTDGIEGSYWDEMIGSLAKIREGRELCFRVSGYESATQKLKIDLNGADSDCLTSYWDQDSNCTVYRLLPTDDLTVTIDVEKRKQYTVTLNKGEGINNCYVSIDGDGSEGGKWGQFTAPEEAYILIDYISWESASDTEMGKVVCTVNGESYEVKPEYTGAGCAYGFYVTGDMTVDVSVKDTMQHTLNFADSDIIESVQVWKYRNKSDSLQQTADGQFSLRNDIGYAFDFQLKDGLVVSSVVMRDKTDGSEKVLERQWNYDYEVGDPESDLGYQIGVPCGDLEIMINTVPGYTVKFDLSKAEDAVIYASPTDENPISGSEIVSSLTEDTCFYLDDEDRYKLSIDSDVFTLQRVKQVTYDMDGELRENYVYRITPNRTENLPAAVTVTVEAYEKHKIELVYADDAAIKNISLSGRGGNTFRITNKTANVYGTDLVLAITPVSGYAATVIMQGTGGEETLSPYRVNGSTNEYFLGELTEDKTVRITVARSSQKQTYYEVGFLSPGGRVTVREPVHHTEYEVFGNEEDYTTSYSILKGSSITFYVEPAYNYALDGVYANGKAVAPVYDEKLQCNIYTVTPVETTQIRMNTSKIVEKYPITFSYPDTVSAVTVKDYILTENTLSVPEGTKLCFSVGIADPQYKVESVRMNGKDIPYSRSEGGYVLTTLAEPMEVVITTCEAGETGGETDKKALEECINKYKDYEKTAYTEESWIAFEKALQEASDCMSKTDASQEEVAAAIAALEKAAGELVKKGDDPKPPTPPTPDMKEGLWFEILENAETADGSYVYTGAAIKPEIKVYNGDTLLDVKKDYTAAYKNNTNAGPATITVTGKGNFKGKATAVFTIEPKNIGDEDISAADVYAVINNKGKVNNPKVAVKYGKKTLKANNDYKVIYPELETVKDADGKDQIVAKDYTITIETAGVKKNNKGVLLDSVNYTGSRTIKYTVRNSDTKLMSKAKVTLEKMKVDYAGAYGVDTEKPAVTSVKIGGKDVPDTEYTVSYENWDQAGKATVTVTAKEGTVYYGSKSVTYTVNGTKLTAGDLTISNIESSYEYTGQEIFATSANGDPMKVTRIKGAEAPVELKEGRDYEVSYKTGKKVGEHTNTGTVTVTITGINAYTGSVNKTFKITPVDLTDYGTDKAPAGFAFAAEGKAKYTKTGAKPEITKLSYNGTALAEKQDYTVSYQKNTKVESGKESATMLIKGKGNFKGQIRHEYEVTMASADDVYATAVDIVKPAKLNQVKSTVKIFEASTGKALKAGTDYDKAITYYSDEACTTQITAENFETATAVDQVIYAKVTMKGNYADTGEAPGSVTTSFRVYDKDLKMTSKKLVVTVDTTTDKDGNPIACDTTKAKNPYYTGAAIEPKVTVTLKGSGGAEDKVLTEDTDYTVAYTNNTNKGKATITLTGIGNGYGGTKSVKFTIVSAEMSWAEKASEATEKALEIFSELILQN